MNVRVIARDSRNYVGRKCPLCKKVTRPGQTIIQDGHWVAHRKCVNQLIHSSYVDIPFDGEIVKRTTRAEKEERARKRNAQLFADYRDHLVQRYGVEEEHNSEVQL